MPLIFENSRTPIFKATIWRLLLSSRLYRYDSWTGTPYLHFLPDTPPAYTITPHQCPLHTACCPLQNCSVEHPPRCGLQTHVRFYQFAKRGKLESPSSSSGPSRHLIAAPIYHARLAEKQSRVRFPPVLSVSGDHPSVTINIYIQYNRTYLCSTQLTRQELSDRIPPAVEGTVYA